MKALLEARRQELHDAQHFMGTADTISESEIVQQVRDLNTEIFNLAQSMSDAKPRTAHALGQQEAGRALTDMLHDRFLHILQSASLHGDTVLLEIAMQQVASQYLSDLICTWTNNHKGDRFFECVYRRICRSGKRPKNTCHFNSDTEFLQKVKA